MKTFKEFIETTELQEQKSKRQIEQGLRRIEFELRTRKDLSPGERLILEALILMTEDKRHP
jgi:hypothetical protein